MIFAWYLINKIDIPLGARAIDDKNAEALDRAAAACVGKVPEEQ